MNKFDLSHIPLHGGNMLVVCLAYTCINITFHNTYNISSTHISSIVFLFNKAARTSNIEHHFDTQKIISA